MTAGPRQSIVAPADLAGFLVTFGLVPLLLASEFVGRIGPPAQDYEPAVMNDPWSYALTPTWSLEQFVFVALAGAVLGWTANRPAPGLAAAGLGILLGLSADLWWLAGFVKPEDQTFVTMLTQAEWHSRLGGSALGLLGAVSAGFLIGAVIRALIRSGPRRLRSRPTRPEAFALGLAIIGGPLMAIGIASVAASSALVVPDGAQVQRVRVSAGAITLDPVVLRPGSTRFLCDYSLDAVPAWAYLIPLPEGVDGETVSPSFDDYDATCGVEPGVVTWGTVADLQPGRYVWMQIDNETEVLQEIATSPVLVVAP